MYCSSVDEINGKHYIFTFCGIVPTRADHLYPVGRWSEHERSIGHQQKTAIQELQETNTNAGLKNQQRGKDAFWLRKQREPQ
jgi:hypothetical protein